MFFFLVFFFFFFVLFCLRLSSAATLLSGRVFVWFFQQGYFVPGGVRRQAKQTDPIIRAGELTAKSCVTGNLIKRTGVR